MDDLESKAFKISLMWEDYCKREFPNERCTCLPKKKDPRKSILFKYCYKLAKETLGIIPDNEYRLYVIAQLQVLKSLKKDGVHGMIAPQILTGPQAWKRWKYWKFIYNQRMAQVPDVESTKSNVNLPKINKDFNTTKNFLAAKIKPLTINGLETKIEDLSLIRWVLTEKVTPLYIILSPWVRSKVTLKIIENNFNIDLAMHRPKITKEVEDLFEKVFDYEF